MALKGRNGLFVLSRDIGSPALSPAQELALGWGQGNGIGTRLLSEIMESQGRYPALGMNKSLQV